jgi:hypothetical protein
MPWSIKREITIREVILLLGLLSMGAVWFARGETHITDDNKHLNREALELRVEQIQKEVNYVRKRFDEVHPPQ